LLLRAVLNSPAQVMAEIMAKSKASKRERAKDKEADDEHLDELDSVFKSLADVSWLALACDAPLADSRLHPPGRRAARQPPHLHWPPQGWEAATTAGGGRGGRRRRRL
jgi:hypothetical protein